MLYPRPTPEWVTRYTVCSPAVIEYGLKMGLLKASNPSNHEAAGIDRSTPVPEDDANRTELFKVLFLYLYISWFSIDRPLAALEDMVLDFRDEEAVYSNPFDLLGYVAGIAERDSEAETRKLARALIAHHALYPVLERFRQTLLNP